MENFRPSWTLLSLTLGLVLGSAAPAAAQPTFELGFDCPGCPPGNRLEGVPGETVSFEVAATLRTQGLEPAEPGAQGWSISVVSEGGWINWASVAALGDLPDTAGALAREGGFEQTEFTRNAEPGSECEGLRGVVSTVVLPFEPPATLDPGTTHPVLNIRVSGKVPFDGDCVPIRLFYADGCQGAGESVYSGVTYGDAEVTPTRGEQSFTVCRREDCSQDRLNVMVQTEAIPESELPFDGMLTDDIDEAVEIELPTPVGQTASLGFFAAIVSQGLETGVQGWSFSISVRGDLEAVAITVEGTSAEVALDGGFQVSEMVNPDAPCSSGEPQGDGFVSAVVLSLTNSHTLLPTGTASVLDLTVGMKEPQGANPLEGLVRWFDGLSGSG